MLKKSEGVYMSKRSYIHGVFNFSGNWQESMFPLYFMCDVFVFSSYQIICDSPILWVWSA